MWGYISTDMPQPEPPKHPQGDGNIDTNSRNSTVDKIQKDDDDDDDDDYY